MAEYTVEYTFLVPHYVHETFEAPDKAAAIAEAKRKLDADDIGWNNQEADYDNTRATVITGMWESDEAYRGAEIDVPDSGHPEEIIIPQLVETIRDLSAALRNACGETEATRADRKARLKTADLALHLVQEIEGRTR
jgi:hypothetical protein